MKRHHWIITYDIADSRRLSRIHRRVAQCALPLQYSVYLFHGTRSELDDLMQTLASHISPSEDDIRAYPVPHQPFIIHEGRSLADESIYLFGAEVEGFTGISAGGTDKTKEVC